MIPAPKYHSYSRRMDALEVEMKPVFVASHFDVKDVGPLLKRKRVLSESEQGQKRSISAHPAPPKIKSSAKQNCASVSGKRKRPIQESDPEMDTEHVLNAAQALFELFGGAEASFQKGDKSCNVASPKSAAAGGGVKWAMKKSRTSRSSKKADDCLCKLSFSTTTSATVTDTPEVLDSSASNNHHIVAPFPQEAVHLDDDSEADADAKSIHTSPSCIGLDRGHRLLSQSSVESTLLDSRAESPSSPLRVFKDPNVALISNLEEEMLLQFGFQKQPLLRPATKPPMLRQPKVEEKSAVQFYEVKEVKVSVKQVQRRKPRTSNLKAQPLLLQGDVFDVHTATSTSLLKECIEENKFDVLETLNLLEPVKLEVGRVKEESREPFQSSTQGRYRCALSEAEKEARRLRRVQANRESARQTIRRKQVLCEELARKAGVLQSEKDNLTLSLEAKSKELRNHEEINRQLKEQIFTQAEEPLASSMKVSNNIALAAVPPTGSIPQGMQMMPYWWAFALAKSVAAASQCTAAAPLQMGEIGAIAASLPHDSNAIIAATIAAFNSGAGWTSNSWMSMTGHMSTNESSLSEMVSAVDLKRPAESVPIAADDRPQPPPPQSLGRSTSMLATAHTYPTFSLSKANPNANSTVNANSSVKYQLTTGAQAVRSVSRGFEAVGNTSTTLSLGLNPHSQQQLMRKPASLRFFPIIGNGVQGYLGPRLGVHQTEAAALATEARRRRRELKRTKSLQSQLQQEKKLASVKSL